MENQANKDSDYWPQLSKYADNGNSSPAAKFYHHLVVLTPEDGEAAKRFLVSKTIHGNGGRGVSPRRLEKLAIQFKRLSEFVGVPFVELTTQNAAQYGERFYRAVKESSYADWTKHGLIVQFKDFVTFLNKRPPEWLDNIYSTKPEIKQFAPELVITWGDTKRLIDATPNLSEKAAIAVIHSAGCRPSELTLMKVGGYRQTPGKSYRDILVPKTKTTERWIPFNEAGAADVLEAWLNAHPRKNEPNAPLFVGIQGKTLQYRAFYERLKQLAKKSGWPSEKPINPYWFRHSAISRAYAAGFTNEEVTYAFGTHQFKVYDHSGIEKVRARYEKVHGTPQKLPTSVLPETFDDLVNALLSNEKFLEKLKLETEKDYEDAANTVFKIGEKLYDAGVISDYVVPYSGSPGEFEGNFRAPGGKRKKVQTKGEFSKKPTEKEGLNL